MQAYKSNRQWFRFQAVWIWLSISVWFKSDDKNCIVDHHFDLILISFHLNSTTFLIKRLKKMTLMLIKRLKKSNLIKKSTYIDFFNLIWPLSIIIDQIRSLFELFDKNRTQYNPFRHNDWFGFRSKIQLKSDRNTKFFKIWLMVDSIA